MFGKEDVEIRCESEVLVCVCGQVCSSPRRCTTGDGGPKQGKRRCPGLRHRLGEIVKEAVLEAEIS